MEEVTSLAEAMGYVEEVGVMAAMEEEAGWLGVVVVAIFAVEEVQEGLEQGWGVRDVGVMAAMEKEEAGWLALL